MKPHKEYLIALLIEVNKLKDAFDYSDIDASDAEVEEIYDEQTLKSQTVSSHYWYEE